MVIVWYFLLQCAIIHLCLMYQGHHIHYDEREQNL